jgi:hypothetical protein
MEAVTQNFMEKILDKVNQKEQDALKKFQDTTNEELEKTQKQLNELREPSTNTKVKQRTL